MASVLVSLFFFIIFASVLGAGVAIPTNADLNNYKTPGLYFIDSDGTATSVSNTPVNYGAVVEVLSLRSNLIQRYMISGSGKIYQRRYQYSADLWYGWYRFEGTAMQ